MEYRKIYEQAIGRKIPEGFEIHHIDLNRKNNKLSNLVMLPKELHQEYHKRLGQLENRPINTNITSIIQGGANYNNYVLNSIIKFQEILEECNQWCDYKYYLIGVLPNIHDIEVEEWQITKNTTT